MRTSCCVVNMCVRVLVCVCYAMLHLVHVCECVRAQHETHICCGGVERETPFLPTCAMRKNSWPHWRQVYDRRIHLLPIDARSPATSTTNGILFLCVLFYYRRLHYQRSLKLPPLSGIFVQPWCADTVSALIRASALHNLASWLAVEKSQTKISHQK